MRVATDIGGTFTDLVAVDDLGRTLLAKSGIHPQEITDFIHGTTTIINALTERKGAKTALITTKGFRDVLEIARCNRPDTRSFGYRHLCPGICCLKICSSYGNCLSPFGRSFLLFL